VPAGRMSLIETITDAETIEPADPDRLAFLTQTTLSVDDTAEIVAVLRRRFPSIALPRSEDICYATSNRQAAVKSIAGRCDAMLVIGASNSSNSVRLVEVAERAGTRARLVARGKDVDFEWLEGVRTLGITAGASAPEVLVREVVDRLKRRYNVHEEPVEGVEEAMVFKLPAGLRAA
jgi:4-hydroxy-3-methylbut-2-enyl diphosphate reductase